MHTARGGNHKAKHLQALQINSPSGCDCEKILNIMETRLRRMLSMEGNTMKL